MQMENMNLLSEEELNKLTHTNVMDIESSNQSNHTGGFKMNNTHEVTATPIKNTNEKLIVPVAGAPTNDTIFPKEEKMVWKEIKRVIHEMVQSMGEQGGYRMVIPIWNKFDLEFLRASEKYGVPVLFVIPFATWGESRLPKFQTDLVKRMKANPKNRVHIYKGGSFTERVHGAIKEADMVIGFHGTSGLEQFYSAITEAKQRGARVEMFPVNRMQFTTEQQAQELLQTQADNSAVAHQDVDSVLEFS